MRLFHRPGPRLSVSCLATWPSPPQALLLGIIIIVLFLDGLLSVMQHVQWVACSLQYVYKHSDKVTIRSKKYKTLFFLASKLDAPEYNCIKLNVRDGHLFCYRRRKWSGDLWLHQRFAPTFNKIYIVILQEYCRAKMAASVSREKTKTSC